MLEVARPNARGFHAPRRDPRDAAGSFFEFEAVP